MQPRLFSIAGSSEHMFQRPKSTDMFVSYLSITRYLLSVSISNFLSALIARLTEREPN